MREDVALFAAGHLGMEMLAKNFRRNMARQRRRLWVARETEAGNVKIHVRLDKTKWHSLFAWRMAITKIFKTLSTY